MTSARRSVGVALATHTTALDVARMTTLARGVATLRAASRLPGMDAVCSLAFESTEAIEVTAVARFRRVGR